MGPAKAAGGSGKVSGGDTGSDPARLDLRLWRADDPPDARGARLHRAGIVGPALLGRLLLMPHFLAVRPASISCACGASVHVKRDGPIPKRCADCVRVDQIERLLIRLCEGVAGVHAVRVARTLDAASERIKRRVGVL